MLALGGLHVDNLCAWLEQWAGLEREFGLVDLLGASCANAPASLSQRQVNELGVAAAERVVRSNVEWRCSWAVTVLMGMVGRSKPKC